MPRKSVEADFWLKLALDDETGCWNFTGKLKPDGYGRVHYGKRCWQAQYLAYIFVYVVLPEGTTQVNHTCHNRRCCNPAHLYAGTQADNMADMVAAGRQATLANGRRPRYVQKRVYRGEEHCRAKLTEEKVREMRCIFPTLPKFGRWSILARRYGVADSAIHSIIKGKTWRHVQVETV